MAEIGFVAESDDTMEHYPSVLMQTLFVELAAGEGAEFEDVVGDAIDFDLGGCIKTLWRVRHGR